MPEAHKPMAAPEATRVCFLTILSAPLAFVQLLLCLILSQTTHHLRRAF